MGVRRRRFCCETAPRAGWYVMRHACATVVCVGLFPIYSRLVSTHLFGRYLCSLPVPCVRRDMQHTCFFPHYLTVS